MSTKVAGHVLGSFLGNVWIYTQYYSVYYFVSACSLHPLWLFLWLCFVASLHMLNFKAKTSLNRPWQSLKPYSPDTLHANKAMLNNKGIMDNMRPVWEGGHSHVENVAAQSGTILDSDQHDEYNGWLCYQLKWSLSMKI